MRLVDVGAQLRRARLAAGMTMRELATRAELSHQLVEKVESGQNTTLATLERLAVAAEATLTVKIERPPSGPRALPPVDRLAVASRFLAILPKLSDESVDVLLAEIALWETEHAPQAE
jgi:transcriptional regulator with XRE-family HTH domain